MAFGISWVMSKRTSQIQITPEGRVLKSLREKHGLSMQAAAKLMGCSDSWISQIENGRADAPKGKRLDKFLKVYGDIGQKYFYELAREWKAEVTDLDLLQALLPKLKPDQIKMMLLRESTFATRMEL